MSEFELNSYNNGYSSSDGGSSAIGDPIITLSNNLANNEIWLEGATVSRTEYSKLFKIYGTTYGSGDGSTTFVLPDFRNRAVWGADSFGYLSAGLPNIYGKADADVNADTYLGVVYNGTSAFVTETYTSSNNTAKYSSSGTNYNRGRLIIDASAYNSIYGASDTVQPPAIKVRVKTRYK